MANNPDKPTSKSTSTTTKSTYEPGALFWSTRAKGPSRTGVLIFSTLRILDLPLQFYLLHHWGTTIINRMGGTPVPNTHTPGSTSPYRTPYLFLPMLFACGAAAKQVFWLLAINQERFPPLLASGAGVYNTVMNTINALFALWTVTSQCPSTQASVGSFLTSAPSALLIGVPMYALGLWLEWYSEIQRHRFKTDPNNKGKPFSDGLFGYARNINYGGYTLWRTGYSLVCGGWIWGAVMATWFAGDFISRAIPSMDVYCEQRYGVQWEEVRRKVPYKLLPWIY